MFFRDIIGQQKVKKSLLASAKSGRVSHAQLFESPEGSGNLALAVAYAQYLCCKDQQEEDACGECPSCLKFAKLTHPDLHFSFPITLSSKTKTPKSLLGLWREQLTTSMYFTIDHWKKKLGQENKQAVINAEGSVEILKAFELKSYEGGYRVLIIWMPELMNNAAANKLLKLIEEPPPLTIILLVANQTDPILPTILSRVQVVKIPRLSALEVEGALRAQTGEGEELCKRIAARVNGSFWEGLQLIQSGESDQHFELFREWMRKCFKKDMDGLVKWVDEASALGREQQKELMRYGMDVVEQSLWIRHGMDAPWRFSSVQMEFIEKFSSFAGKDYAKLSSVFKEGHEELKRNANSKIMLMDMSFTFMEYLNG